MKISLFVTVFIMLATLIIALGVLARDDDVKHTVRKFSKACRNGGGIAGELFLKDDEEAYICFKDGHIVGRYDPFTVAPK